MKDEATMELSYTIDRFEGTFAVCEDDTRHTILLPVDILPKGCKEGDVITKIAGIYVKNPKATEDAKRRIQGKMDRLIKK